MSGHLGGTLKGWNVGRIESFRRTKGRDGHFRGEGRGTGGFAVGETCGMIAGNWITVKVQYLGTYHSNVRRGSGGRRRSCGDFRSLMRREREVSSGWWVVSSGTGGR